MYLLLTIHKLACITFVSSLGNWLMKLVDVKTMTHTQAHVF